MKQANSRRDIEVGTGAVVLPFLFGIVLGQVTRDIDFAVCKYITGFTQGLELEDGDFLSIEIPMDCKYRMSMTVRYNVIAGEALSYGIGFCQGAASINTVFAMTTEFMPTQGANQHLMLSIYSEKYLQEGDILSFVSFGDLADMTGLSVGEPAFCSLYPVLKAPS